MDSAQILDTLVWEALTLVCLLNFLLIRRVSRDLDALWDYLGGQRRLMAQLLTAGESRDAAGPVERGGSLDELLGKFDPKGRQ